MKSKVFFTSNSPGLFFRGKRNAIVLQKQLIVTKFFSCLSFFFFSVRSCRKQHVAGCRAPVGLFWLWRLSECHKWISPPSWPTSLQTHSRHTPGAD